MPIIDENPGDGFSIKRVYDKLLDWGIKGRRKWYVGSDAGALDETQLSPEATHVMGTGYEVTIEERCMNMIACHYGGDLLAFAHGFFSEGSPLHLFKDLDNKKVKAFLLDICRPAVVSFIIREWMQTIPVTKDINVPGGKIYNFEDLLLYLEDAKFVLTRLDDTTFKSKFFFWITDSIPSLALAVKGQNCSELFGHSTGRKGILPYLWVRNHKEYGRLIIRDTFDFYFRCTDEVLHNMIDFFCYQGDGKYSCEGFD